MLLTTTSERNAGDATDLGALTPSDTRVTYVADWYDSLGRQTNEV